MKKILLASFCALFIFSNSGCGVGISDTNNGVEINTNVGEIGEAYGVTRGQVAKMIALSYYTKEQLDALEITHKFSDLSEQDWEFIYVKGCVGKGIFLSSNEFRGSDYVTLQEAQNILENLVPDFANQIILTDENKNQAISYNLWVDTFQKVVFNNNANNEFDNHGIYKKTNVILNTLDNEVGFYDEILQQSGYDLETFKHQEISFLAKGNEILALLEVTNLQPVFKNVYYVAKDNQLQILGSMEAVFPYEGDDSHGFGDVKIIDNIAQATSLESIGKYEIRRFDKNTNVLYLENYGAVDVVEGFKVYDDMNIYQYDYELIAGTDTTEFYISDDGEIVGGMALEMPIPYDIKVLLGGGSHNGITLNANGNYTLDNGNISEEFTNVATDLNVNSPWFENGGILKIIADEIKIAFDGGTVRGYTGDVEIEVINGKLVAVETSNMEEYLKGVVPHEMPSTFGKSALEAQAICARSYAYNEFFINTYGGFGANITDTTASQVYNGSYTTTQAVEAVNNTAGMCLVSGDKVAQTYFYSTSSGFGARDVEVWSADGSFSGVGKSYLDGKQHGVEEEMPTTEAEWVELFSDWSISGYDENSPFYRWKAYFEVAQMEEILNKKLVEVATDYGGKVSVKVGDGEFVNEIPSDLGAFQSIEIAQRGESGVVEIIEMKFANKTVRVATENAIRKVIVPQKMTVGNEIYLMRKDGASVATQTMLPSGFFAMDYTYNEDNNLTGIQVYGGGFGHGVGLSQYGAKELSERGFTAEEILKEYYSNVEIAKVL